MEVFTAYREVLLPDGSVSELEIPLAYANDPVGPVSLVEAARRGYDLSLIKDKDGGQLLSNEQIISARATAAGVAPICNEAGRHFVLPTIGSVRAEYEAGRGGAKPVLTQMEEVTVKPDIDNIKKEMQASAGLSTFTTNSTQLGVYVGPSQNTDVQKYLKEEQYEQEKKLPAMICDWLVKKYLIKIWKGEVYLYNLDKKYFQRMNNRDVDYIINMNFGEKIKSTGSPSSYDLARNFLRREAGLVISDDWTPPKYTFAFRNVFFNSLTGETFINDGSIFTPHALNADYDPGAECPLFDAFMMSVSGQDELVSELIWEAIGYLLSNDLSAKTFFVLVGEKDTGKSLLANLITRIVGEDVTKHLSLSDFSGRFALADLQGAHLNICMDLPDTPLSAEAVGRIKSYTGNDGIRSDVKNKDAISFLPTAHLLFGSNHRVMTTVRDKAFEERLVEIPFSNPVPKERQDPDLLEKLFRERNGICRKAIDAYLRLRNKRYIFPAVKVEGPSSYIDRDELLKNFVSTKIEYTGDDADFAPTADIFKAFQGFCEELRLDLGLRPQQFSVLLVKYLPENCSRVKRRTATYPNPANGINRIKIRL